MRADAFSSSPPFSENNKKGLYRSDNSYFFMTNQPTQPHPISGLRQAFQAVKRDVQSLTAWVLSLRDHQTELKYRMDKLEAKVAELERKDLLR